MAKKGFLNFLKNIGQHDEEDERQRAFAKSQRTAEKQVKPKKEKEAPKAPKIETSNQAPKPTKDKAKQQPVNKEAIDYAKEKLETLLQQTQFGGTVSTTVEEEGLILLEITDSEDTGRIIGRDGSTIDSLQILIRAMVYQKYREPMQILVDSGGYRQKRLENARSRALRVANYINENNPKESLSPMSAAERRAVHMLFQEDSSLKTYSEGEGSKRHIVIEKQ